MLIREKEDHFLRCEHFVEFFQILAEVLFLVASCKRDVEHLVGAGVCSQSR